MTTEAALRSALEEATRWLRGAGKPSDNGAVCETLDDVHQMIAAALALPVEERTAYRVVWGLCQGDGWWESTTIEATERAARITAECLASQTTRYRGVRIESRSVSTGPWLPLESKS